MARKLSLVGAVLILFGFGVFGLLSGLEGRMGAFTLSQQVVTWGELLYAALGAAAIAATLRWRRYARPLLYTWGAVVTVCAGLAPMAWGDVGLGTGVLQALPWAAVAALAIWLATWGMSSSPAAPPSQ
jgi:hypothetical protein